MSLLTQSMQLFSFYALNAASDGLSSKLWSSSWSQRSNLTINIIKYLATLIQKQLCYQNPHLSNPDYHIAYFRSTFHSCDVQHRRMYEIIASPNWTLIVLRSQALRDRLQKAPGSFQTTTQKHLQPINLMPTVTKRWQWLSQHWQHDKRPKEKCSDLSGLSDSTQKKHDHIDLL